MKYSANDFSDLELTDLRTYEDERLLYEFYENVYKPAFPIETQREDPSVWIGRLWGSDSEDTTFELHALIIGKNIRDPSRRIIYGGSLFEYYGESRSGLLTYMVVVPEARGKGLGTLLYTKTMDILRNIAAIRGVDLSAIYGEVENPLRTTPSDVMDTWDRLRIIQKWGGSVLDIEYIQPALMPGQGSNRDLLLLHFSQDDRQLPSVPSRLVLDFLTEFYTNLSAVDLSLSHDFNEVRESISGDTIRLVTMIPEEPVLEFQDYGIALHFVKASNSDEVQGDSLNPGATPASNVFQSFERDLISYSFRHSLPFRSVPAEFSCGSEVELVFPVYLDFVSEGRTWRLCKKDASKDSTRVRIRVVLSKTVFSTGVIIHNVVLTSCNSQYRTPLDEYDIIKLVKLYAPSEEVDVAGHLRILFEDNETDLSLFLDRISGASVITLGDLRAGTLQLLTGEERGEEWHEVFRLCELLNSARNEAITQIDQLMKDEAPTAKQLMAINGILTGIFDFHRIDAWEIADVYQSIYDSAEQLLYLHKGNIMCITAQDRPFELPECRSHIGISPYLILPHNVLLHDEEILNRAANAVPGHSVHDIRTLEAARAQIDKLLSADLLPNVFQYISERSIFDCGYRERGLEQSWTVIRKSLDWLTRRIEAHARVRERKADISLRFLVTLLTVVLLKDIVFDLLASYPSWQWPTYSIVIAVVVVVFCVHIVRAGKT